MNILVYVVVGKSPKRSMKDKIKGFLSIFILGINNLFELVFFLYSTIMVFASDDFVEKVFNMAPNIMKVYEAKIFLSKGIIAFVLIRLKIR